jgi:uncharacterized membrane protein HdeD (DUF308 family)
MENTEELGWGWYFLVGAFLVIVGIAFLLAPMLATFAAGLAFGALLVVSGAAQGISSVITREPGWGAHLVLGLLALAAGVLMLADPVAGVIGITVLLSAYLLASGAFKVIAAAMWSPRRGWGWILFNGLITAFLGGLILSGMPTTGLWTVGVFLGVDALLAGLSRIIFAFGAEAEGVARRDTIHLQPPRT